MTAAALPAPWSCSKGELNAGKKFWYLFGWTSSWCLPFGDVFSACWVLCPLKTGRADGFLWDFQQMFISTMVLAALWDRQCISRLNICGCENRRTKGEVFSAEKHSLLSQDLHSLSDRLNWKLGSASQSVLGVKWFNLHQLPWPR